MIVERLLRVALLGSAWVMYLLLALSVVSFGAMVERWFFFRKHKDDISDLTRRFHAALARDDLFDADEALAKSPSLEAKVIRSAMPWFDGGADVVESVIESEMERTRRELDRGSTLLGTLGNNAPFVGLLGTVIGVIEAFHQLGDAQTKGAMGNVMAGIAEALVATAVGLFVALPAVVAYNAIQRKIGEVESNVLSITKLLIAILRYQTDETHHVPAPAESRQSEPDVAVSRTVLRDSERRAVTATETAS